jgi:hypothetical protein
MVCATPYVTRQMGPHHADRISCGGCTHFGEISALCKARNRLACRFACWVALGPPKNSKNAALVNTMSRAALVRFGAGGTPSPPFFLYPTIPRVPPSFAREAAWSCGDEETGGLISQNATKQACEKRTLPHSWFAKDPSTSLRISLGGSDAARTAQDVLIRN